MPPGKLLGVLVYGYATGVFSSRKLERATCDSVAFRFIAANNHPDHDTIVSIRLAKLSPTGCERRYFLASLSAKRAMVLA
jgi:transposase